MRKIFVGNVVSTKGELYAAVLQYGRKTQLGSAVIPTGEALTGDVAIGEVQDDGEQDGALLTGMEGRSAALISPELLGYWVNAHVPTAQIIEITSLATEVLEAHEKAVKWLSDPNPATDGRAPIELIGEPQGFERVKNLLLRIEHGVLA